MRKQANSVSQVHLDMRCTDCAKRAKRSRIPSFANNTQNKITRQIKHVETKIDKRNSQTFQLNQMDFSVMWHMAQDSQQPHAFSNIASNRLGNVQGAINTPHRHSSREASFKGTLPEILISYQGSGGAKLVT